MRWGLLLIGIVAACAPPFPAVEGQQLRCASDAECADGHRCHPALALCFDELPACATPTGLQPDGTPCGGGARVCNAGSCLRSECGDGVVDERLDEQCDGTEGCHASCLLNVCGDGIVLGEEACDDGNTLSGDGCRDDCGRVESCGDGVIDSGEVCDGTIGCHVDCTLNSCGDGKVLAGAELCDDGNAVSGDGCRGDCLKLEVCGDGVIDANEACDDGNTNPNDACSGACTLVEWEATVLAGRGPGQGVPADTPLFAAGGMAETAEGDLILSTVFQLLRLKNGVLTPIAGALLGSDPINDGTPATSVRILAFDVEVDGVGRTYFVNSDGETTVERIELDGGMRRLAGGGTLPPSENERATRVALPEVAMKLRGEDLFIASGDGVWRIDREGLMHLVVDAADVNLPQAIDFDDAGRLHVADLGSVLRVEPDGTLTRVAGDPNGPDDEGVPALDARLGQIVGLAVAGGELCVADSGGRVRCIDDDGLVYDAIPLGEISLPRQLRRLRDGSLLVSQQLPGEFIQLRDGVRSTFAGSGGASSATDALQATGVNAAPAAVVTDRLGRPVYADSALGSVRRVLDDGTLETLVEGIPNIGKVLFDPDDNLLILDRVGSELMRLEADGVQTIRTFNAPDPTPCGAGQAPPELDVAFDSLGRMLFIAPDVSSVFRVEDGADVRVAGTGFPGSGGTDIAIEHPLCGPTEIGGDSQGGFFLINKGEREVRHVDGGGTTTRVTDFLDQPTALAVGPGDVITFATQTPSTIRRFPVGGPIEELVVVDSQAPLGDGGPLATAGFQAFRDLHVDPAGALWIADLQFVRRVSPDLQLIDSVAGFAGPPFGNPSRSTLLGPTALVNTPDSKTFLIDSGFAYQLDHDADQLLRVAGHIEGFALTDDVRAPYVRLIDQAAGLAWDGGDKLYISERGQILRLTMNAPDPSTWTVDVFSEAPVAPAGLAYFDGELYVADERDHQVLAISDAGDVRFVYGSPGSPGLLDGFLFEPSAVLVDSTGVFIADRADRVLHVNGGATVEILGPNELDGPRGLAFDSSGNLLVTSSRRVLLSTPGPDSGVIDGTGSTHVLFGAAPIDDLEESTLCLAGVAERKDGFIDILDSCLGFYIELRRAP